MVSQAEMRTRAGGLITALVLLAACNSGKPHASPSTAPITPVSTTSAPVPATTRQSSRTTLATPTPPTKPKAATAADLAAVRVRLQPVAHGLSSPVGVVFRPHSGSPAGAMYVVEQTGTLRLIRDGRASATPALDLRSNLSHGNEQGFLDAAFAPNGADVFVSYTDRNGDTNVDEYAMRGAVADPSTRRRVFFAKQPYSNHNGGEVVFGPDGMLYIGLGDGGSEGDPHNYGQDLSTPLSKILRIDPEPVGRAAYSVPADNPFVNRKGVVPETWMWGLRNPWRFSFDRVTGDTWIGDVGQNAYEEIDFAPRGEQGINWGWSLREGFHAFKGARPAGARDPIVEAPHTEGYCAIVGGYVYRGRAIPSLTGVYLYGDDCRPDIEALVPRGGRAVAQRDLGIQVPDLTTFGEDGTGELYVASRDGTVYRIVSASPA
jgi:glucose/arabinose dehydrogenase